MRSPLNVEPPSIDHAVAIDPPAFFWPDVDAAATRRLSIHARKMRPSALTDNDGKRWLDGSAETGLAGAQVRMQRRNARRAA